MCGRPHPTWCHKRFPYNPPADSRPLVLAATVTIVLAIFLARSVCRPELESVIGNVGLLIITAKCVPTRYGFIGVDS